MKTVFDNIAGYARPNIHVTEDEVKKTFSKMNVAVIDVNENEEYDSYTRFFVNVRIVDGVVTAEIVSESPNGDEERTNAVAITGNRVSI